MAPVITCTPAGLSPRVRVTRPAANPAGVRRRIIPACAGNTLPRARATCRTRDHPRVCGEHETHPVTVAMTLGSSPRVRGTRDQHREGASFQGIIPACAGNTRCPAARRALSRDHPRVCREHSRWTDPEEGTVESSPRVRGTQGCSAGRVKVSGITPACAGNTGHLARSPLPTRDHPRVCGEHVVSFVPVSSRTGSSPRVRGTLGSHFPVDAHCGIIPACAGNTR